MERPGACPLGRWGETRAKGFLRFLLLYGVLAWGLGSAVAFTLLGSLFAGPVFPQLFVRSVVLFGVGGVGWGLFVWLLCELGYVRHCRAAGNCPDGHAPARFTAKFTLRELVVFVTALALAVTLLFAAPLTTCEPCSGTGKQGASSCSWCRRGKVSLWGRWGF